MYLYMVAPCLFGLEGLVAEDLRSMGAQNVTAENGRVFFEGGEDILARANICCRFAERILIVMDRFKAESFTELFDGVKLLNWSDFIGVNGAVWKVNTARRQVFPVSARHLPAGGIPAYEARRRRYPA